MRKNKVLGQNLQQLSSDTGIELPNTTILSLLEVWWPDIVSGGYQSRDFRLPWT